MKKSWQFCLSDRNSRGGGGLKVRGRKAVSVQIGPGERFKGWSARKRGRRSEMDAAAKNIGDSPGETIA